MKNKKILIIIILIIQMMQLFLSMPVKAQISENEEVTLYTDHECDSVVEFYNEKLGLWSYKVVYYVYYSDKDTNEKYPAFCIEPAKNGVGTGYDSYTATIHKIRDINGIERENQVWRILNKGYMGADFQSWNLECDDDLYSATKIALHCLVDGISPVDKYVLGDRSVDGNSVEEIRRRGEKALNVAQTLYEYGLNGAEIYEEPKITLKENGKNNIDKIEKKEYYIQNYIINSNRELKSYEISIQNFPNGTKILNSNNEEVSSLNSKKFKVAIPTSEISENINGTIMIKNAYVKTNPIFYCKSTVDDAQSYATYTSSYEIADTSAKLEIKANTCELLIKKVDEETNKPIANVKFEILDSNKKKIIEVETNEKGEANISNLRPQTIYIKEIKTKEGYILSNEEKKIVLEYGKTAVVTLKNTPKKGQIRVIKVDENNNEIKLNGVEFEILDEKDNVLEKLITDENGEAVTKEYLLKDYSKLKIREVNTLENYILNDEIKTIELEEGKIKDVIFENKKKEEPPKLPRTGF